MSSWSGSWRWRCRRIRPASTSRPSSGSAACTTPCVAFNRPGVGSRAAAGRADAALLRADRGVHRRDAGDDHRPGRARDRRAGPRVRGAQALPGDALAGDARRGLRGTLMPPRRRAPYRILLPLANPRTARDLVRIGSGVCNGRATEITALGIVEVPEGVSLSQGATQARTARRLLQRVLDFGDEERVEIRTMVRIGRRAADGVIEAVAEEGTDLVIFGWGGPPSPPRPPGRRRRAVRGVMGRRSSRRPSTRWCANRRATSRWSSSAAWTTCARSWSRSAAGRTPSWRCAWPATWASASGRRWWCCTSCRRGPASARCSASRRRSTSSCASTAARDGCAASCARRHRSATPSSARRRTTSLVVMGASAQPSNAAPDGRFLFGRVADTVASKAKPTVIVVKTEAGRWAWPTFDELRAAEGTPGRRRRVRRAQPLAADRGRPLVRREHVPRLRVPRHRAAWSSSRRSRA